MKKHFLMILSIVLLLSICSCSIDTVITESTAALVTPNIQQSATEQPMSSKIPEPPPKTAPRTKPKATSTNELAPSGGYRAAMLNSKALEAQILDSGLTLEDIAIFFLNDNDGALLEWYGDGLDWIRNYYQYKEYSYDNKGITIGFYTEDFNEDYISKYIELDRDRISFLGISSTSRFQDVIKVLGKTELHVIEDGLPGLVTYELRYQFKYYSDYITLRIYSYDKDGDGGIYMNVSAAIDPRFRTVRITPEQISSYFKMTRKELESELGMEYESYSETSLNYERYGISFDYDEKGKQLLTIDIYGNYQLNDIKQGYSMDDVMAILGQRKVYTHVTSEDGPIYYIQYKYDNFILQVMHFFGEGWGTYWVIKSTKYDGLW